MALAGQAFAALLPLLIVVGAASPDDGRDVADTLIDEFRLSGSAAEALRGALARPSGPGSAIGHPELRAARDLRPVVHPRDAAAVRAGVAAALAGHAREHLGARVAGGVRRLDAPCSR